MALDGRLERRGLDAALSRARDEKSAWPSRVLRRVVRWGRAKSLWIWPFGHACCGHEPVRSLIERADLRSSGVEIASTWREADLLVVSGVVTLKGLCEVRELLDEMPSPRWVLSLGHREADPSLEIYAVAGSVNDAVPVDVRVPGCPPTPGSLLDGLNEIRRLIQSRG